MGVYEYIIAIVIFLIGLLSCGLIKQGELWSTCDKYGAKHYTLNGKLYYLLVFILWELYVVLQVPHEGMAAFEPVFQRSTSFGTTLFSLNGLYTDEMEPLFLLWCYIIRSFTSNYKIFFVLSCTIIFLCVLRFISVFIKNVKHIYALMLFWPVLIDFVFGIRYGLSVGYCLIVLVYLKERKYIKMSIFMVLAVFTHFVAIAFVMFIVAYLFFRNFAKEKIYSFKTILLLICGVLVFSRFAFSIYKTFRVSYRVTDELLLRNILSYLPYIVFMMVILYCKGKHSYQDNNKDICVLGTYFNTVMIPITIQWGIYRLPYLFIIPTAIELTNTFSDDDRNDRLVVKVTILIVLVFSFVKILTMGVQNYSLYFEWIF